LNRALAAKSVMMSAADAHGIDWRMLAAIGIRETGFQNIVEAGGGMGRGVGFVAGASLSSLLPDGLSDPWLEGRGPQCIRRTKPRAPRSPSNPLPSAGPPTVASPKPVLDQDPDAAPCPARTSVPYGRITGLSLPPGLIDGARPLRYTYRFDLIPRRSPGLGSVTAAGAGLLPQVHAE
jgi:hypothetical protein